MSDASVIQICNWALDRIGASDNITSLDEESAAAEKCNLWYEHCRDATLRDFPWNFSRRSQALAEVSGDAPPGWAYQYRYPAECLTARQVTDAYGARRRWFDLTPGSAFAQWAPPKIPFEISSDEAGRLILTDLTEAYLIFTARIEDLNFWDETAKSALAWKLATELVTPLSLDKQRKAMALQEYYTDLSRATAHNFNESMADKDPESGSIQVRS